MKKRIAIAAGGDSGEYDISVRSAAVVKEHIDTGLYDPYVIEIRGREWKYVAPDDKVHYVDKDDFSLNIDGKKLFFDAVFIAIHGTPGEDGKLQGYLDMLGIPYTSCDHISSALTFDKYFCSRVVSSFEVKVARSMLLRRGTGFNTVNILRTTGLPCFVKPNRGGSSVGMSKVKEDGELLPAIERAFMEDEQVLVEGYIPGREITCGVIWWEGQPRSLPVTEIISKKDFFDYEAKYSPGVADEITPADIPADVEQLCRTTSEMLYDKLNCKGFVRFDYIFNDDGMYFLEVNTVPGLSPNSIVPQQALADGISLKELFSLAIGQALDS